MDYYKEIKNELIDNELTKKAKDYSKNRSDLVHYFNVGKLLIDAGKHYGEGILKEYSIKLTNDLGKGYTESRLRYFRRFYEVFSKCPTLSDELSFSHYCEIIWLDIDAINYYVIVAKEQLLSVRKLREKVKLKEYQRLDNETKNKLINKRETNVTDFVKNPIIIKNSININDISEKYLKKLIIEDMDCFLKELGNSFTYVGNEYKIKIGDRFNYIDILLFNIEFNCYVVIELKITELKKEHIGGIEVYMNYIDKHIKKISHDKTIGIILCKHDNKLVLEYCSDSRIFTREYVLI